MMRKLTLLTLAAALLVSPLAAEEMTLEQVLEAHYDAIGGLEALKAIDSIRFTATMTGGMGEAPVVWTQKRPNNIRQEFTMQGMTGIQAYDGETAWGVMPFMGKSDPEEMAEDQAQSIIEQAEFDGPLVDWEEKGHKLELIGLEEIEGTEAYHVQVTKSDGEVRHHYLESEYFIIIKQTGKATRQGQEFEFETTLSDYKEVGGLMMPHSIQSGVKGGQQANITIDSIELDVEIPDDYFSMPATADE
jgi:outer membrane lipoprotein-sorting protein